MWKVLAWLPMGAAFATVTWRSRYLRYYLLRIEALLILCFLASLWFYVRWLIERHRPLMRGSNLLKYDIAFNDESNTPAQIIDIGFQNLTREENNIWTLSKRDFCYYAMQGLRTYMEDRMHYLRDPYLANLKIYGIFDGHGGKAIVTEMHNIDNSIFRMDPAQTALTGSTLIAAIIMQNKYVTIVNVGDSRAVLCDREGKAVALSSDHKPTDEEELRRIESAGGFVSWNGVYRVQGILATSRAFGDTYLKRLDVVTAHPDVARLDLALERPRFLILASDGVWDVMSNQQAVDIVAEQLNSGRADACHRAAKHLIEAAIDMETLDNVSAFVIRFKHQQQPTTLGYSSSFKRSQEA